MAVKRSYTVQVDELWINDVLRTKGDLVQMTETEAKYYVAPLGNALALNNPEASTEPAKPSGRALAPAAPSPSEK